MAPKQDRVDSQEKTKENEGEENVELRGMAIAARLVPDSPYNHTVFAWLVQKQQYETGMAVCSFILHAWMGYSADHQSSSSVLESDTIFIVIWKALLGIFAADIVIRILAHSQMRACFMNPWFLLDVFLAICLSVEIYAEDLAGWLSAWLSGLQFCRLPRISFQNPEFALLAKAFLMALRGSVFPLVMLLLADLYCSIVIRKATRDTDVGEEYFSSIPNAMLNLFIYGSLPGEQATLMEALVPYPHAMVMFIVFVAVSYFCLAYGLGAVVEIASAYKADGKEGLEKLYLVQELKPISEISDEGEEVVTKTSFLEILSQTPSSLAVFTNHMQSKYSDDAAAADGTFGDCSQLPVEELAEKLLLSRKYPDKTKGSSQKQGEKSMFIKRNQTE